MTLIRGKRLIQEKSSTNEISQEVYPTPPLEGTPFDSFMHDLNEKGYRWHRFGLPYISSYTRALQERAYLSFPLLYLHSTDQKAAEPSMASQRKSSGLLFNKKNDTDPSFFSINIYLNPSATKNTTTRSKSGSSKVLKEKPSPHSGDDVQIDFEYCNFACDVPLRRIGWKEISRVEDHGDGSSFYLTLSSGEKLLNGVYNPDECKSIVTLIEFLIGFTEVSGYHELPEAIQRILLCYHREQLYLNEKKVYAMLFSKRMLIFDTERRLPILVAPLDSYVEVFPVTSTKYSSVNNEDPREQTDTFKLSIPHPNFSKSLSPTSAASTLSDSTLTGSSLSAGGEFIFRTRLFYSALRWVAAIKFACLSHNSLNPNARASQEDSPRSSWSHTMSYDDIDEKLAVHISSIDKSKKRNSGSKLSMRRASDGALHPFSDAEVEGKWSDDSPLNKQVAKIHRRSNSVSRRFATFFVVSYHVIRRY
eukprot:TRINITY_DN2709_c0_g1_i1.p1 TRINITY_DN2709_c0_g1~~TRINITY_DN2709_c0_g1_i1.p1  ORF type:complete len:476 (+),score=78.95 TRINITY_DN2709_c0_g1_i1:724-2151(+)